MTVTSAGFAGSGQRTGCCAGHMCLSTSTQAWRFPSTNARLIACQESKKMRPVLVFTFMLGLANFSAMSWFTVFILTTLARPGHTAACPMRRAGTRTLQGANHNT